jgi:hypothetical protein
MSTEDARAARALPDVELVVRMVDVGGTEVLEIKVRGHRNVDLPGRVRWPILEPRHPLTREGEWTFSGP